MPHKTFQLVHGIEHAVTRELVEHPRTSCVAFTGSLRGRKSPPQIGRTGAGLIPFHGEMGSLNPVFVLPHALEKKGKDLAKAFVTAVNLFSGQMCTKPGILVLIEGQGVDPFLEWIGDAVNRTPSTEMLNRAVFENYHSVARELASSLNLVASNQKDENESENHAFCRFF